MKESLGGANLVQMLSPRRKRQSVATPKILLTSPKSKLVRQKGHPASKLRRMLSLLFLYQNLNRCVARTMKRRQKKLTNLNYDVLKHVIYHLAKSSGGAKSIARAISVLFKEIAYDRDILKAVTFDDINLPAIHESFWLPTALLCTCVGVANLSAADKIADYAGMLNATHKALKRDMFRSRVALVARSIDIEVANTRARKKALDAQ